DEEQKARRIVIEAAVSHLEDAKVKDSKESAALYGEVIRYYQQRLAILQPNDRNRQDITDHHLFLKLFLEAMQVERGIAIRLRDEGHINDEVLRRIERELDLTESRIGVNALQAGQES